MDYLVADNVSTVHTSWTQTSCKCTCMLRVLFTYIDRRFRVALDGVLINKIYNT